MGSLRELPGPNRAYILGLRLPARVQLPCMRSSLGRHGQPRNSTSLCHAASTHTLRRQSMRDSLGSEEERGGNKHHT